jgi:2-methylcitrate dehydratase PrpD
LKPVAAGRLMGFDAAKMTNALGVAGSCAGGLLEFAHAGNGAMVKRLHMGRAAEGGVLAAASEEAQTGPAFGRHDDRLRAVSKDGCMARIRCHPSRRRATHSS